MKKIIAPIAGILMLVLAGCAQDAQPGITVSTQHEVILPNEDMYQCPEVKRFPDVSNLTDLEVAQFIADLYQNNVQCRNSLLAIHSFLDNIKKDLAAQNQSQDP